MEQSEKIIRKKLRNQFNLIGLGLLIMGTLIFGLQMENKLLLEKLDAFFQTLNPLAISLGLEIAEKFIVCLAPFLLVRLLLKIRFKELFSIARLNLSALISWACGGIAFYLFLTFLFSSVAYALNPNLLLSETIHPVFHSSEPWLIVLYLFYFLVLVPFLEEYVFRGVILRCTSWAGGTFGMISSSLLYMLVYWDQGYPLVILFLGMYLSLQAMVYRSIWPSFITHFAINAMIVIGLLLPIQYSWIFGVLTVAAYAVSMYALSVNRNKKLLWHHSVAAGTAWRSFFTSWLLILAIILLIFRWVYYIII